MMRARPILFGAAAAIWLACGSRTGLEVEQQPPADCGETDGAFPDMSVENDCPDAAATLVYVLGASGTLYSFDPTTLTFRTVGAVNCDDASSPFSMAVDRHGIAWSVFSDGRLFEINTKNAACKATSFTPNQDGFLNFGMGFVHEANGTDVLFVVQDDPNDEVNSKGLATIDTTSLRLSLVGGFRQALGACELAGTGDGRLFAYCTPLNQTSGSLIAEFDPATAAILHVDNPTIGNADDAFAFGFWGGQFWIFTSSPSATSTTVTRFDPGSQQESTATTFSEDVIVGAGVSTFAPL
jgi:hypothetical protein